jgi:hypothetical protein
MKKNGSLKYLSPDDLFTKINQFTTGMSVTRGKFDYVVNDCILEDLEWNQMDQMHRHSIHKTYEKNIRIACGPDYAVSLTQWSRWPLFITVSDMYIDKGLFYQSMTIAGIIYLHSIISMEKIEETNNIKLTIEWFIASHKIFKFMHKFLNKKLYTLNTRLQEEDAQIRHGRFALRKQGFHFKTDQPDYFNSNQLTHNTIYPSLPENASISLENLDDENTVKDAGNLQFIVKQTSDKKYQIWPAACPHEGGPLLKGNFCEAQVACPWHGLRFSAVQLSAKSPLGSRYGFEYTLVDNHILIKRSVSHSHYQQEATIESATATATV